MNQKRPGGVRNVFLVWLLGLSLGVGAGALTAYLLIPTDAAPVAQPLRDVLAGTSHSTTP